MGRKRKINQFGVEPPKMLASRVSAQDFWAFETALKKDHKSLQEVVNAFIVSYISGTLTMSGSVIIERK